MSIGSILNMAREGMRAQQAVINTATQNIANAQTAGYSRQRVELQAALPTVFPYGSIGTGVNIAGITRARDTLLDMAFRTDSAGFASAETRSSTLAQVESVFGEPSDTGLSASLDAFWSSWNDLATDPTNAAAKSVVRQAGQNLASTLNRFASQIDALDQYNRDGMNADINSANALAKGIAELNVRVISAESNGQTANDLRDQRDLMLDKLSKLVGGQAIEHSDGSIAYYVGGRMLLDGSASKPLQMNDGQPPTVTLPDNAYPIDGIGGSVGGRMQVSATHIPMVMSKLDAIAKGLVVQQVNAIHSTGVTYNGNPPVAAPAGNFFDVTVPAPVGTDPSLTARGIHLAATMTGPSAVAAAATGTGPGNNAIASALAGLRDNAVSLTALNGSTTATFNDYFNETIGNLATEVRQSADEATVQNTLATQAENRRQNVSGVSTDEELITVIEHQHAYQAAARLVNVVNEMTETLVNLGL